MIVFRVQGKVVRKGIGMPQISLAATDDEDKWRRSQPSSISFGDAILLSTE